MKTETDYLRKYFYAPIFEKNLLIPLSKTPITPDQLTIINIVFAVIISILITLNQNSLILWTGILLILRNGLDCLDGSLARLRNNQTAWGHTLDTFSDKSTEIIISLAIIYICHLNGASFSVIATLMILFIIGMTFRYASKYLKSYLLSLSLSQQSKLKKSLKPFNIITRSILWRLSIIAVALIFNQLVTGLMLYLILNIFYAFKESLPYHEWWFTD